MKTSSKIAIAAAALIAVGALGTTAYAHRDGGGWHGGGYGGGWGHHGGSGHGGWGRRGKRHHMRHRMKKMMKRYDADKDGKVTQAEIDTNRQAMHKEFDANNDGQLSLDEFKQLWLKARSQRIVRAFQRFDADGNSSVTLEEYQEPLANIVKRHDRNGDGALSREDRRRHGGKRWRERMMRGGDDGRMDAEDGGSRDSSEEGNEN